MLRKGYLSNAEGYLSNAELITLMYRACWKRKRKEKKVVVESSLPHISCNK